MKKHESTEKKVFSYLEEHHMIAPHEKIVLGVSGGADSVCLLFLLLEYAKKVPLTLAVVHVNHGIRPDAGEDAEYVGKLCETYNIPFYAVEEDVPEIARLEKCSEEDAGRRVRYRAFEKKAEALGAMKIAVAHNSDDNAETMLMHLFRGSGLGGLCGIAPVRDFKQEETGNNFDCKEGNRKEKPGRLQLIRPLLCLRRWEIEEYLSERGISWQQDSTNDSDDYARNRIRHHIMPYAEQYIAPNAASRMCRTAELLQETEGYLEQQTIEALEKCLVEPSKKSTGRMVLRRDIFRTLHPVLQKRILLKLAKELSPTGKDISQIHVADMLRVVEQEGNRSVNLPMGIVVRQQYTKVILERGNVPRKPEFIRQENPQIIEVNPGQERIYDLGENGKLQITCISMEKNRELPRNQYTKWLDYDKINGYPEIRTRRQGDYLTISGGVGGSRHKSLKDYMITEKIPKEIRDSIPVLAVGSHVLWLVGYRISEDFKVGENTKQILQAKLIIEEQAEQKTEEKNGRAD